MLNTLPIQPINNLRSLGGGIGSTISGLGAGGSLHDKPKSVFDKLDVGQIGKGGRFKEGSYEKQMGRSRGYGLKGQLGVLKLGGRRGVTKNLSNKNIEQIHDLVADRLKKKAVFGQATFSRRDVKAIREETMKLVKTSDSGFTREDRKDALKVVSVMREKYRDKALRRGENSDMSLAGQSPVLRKDQDTIGEPPLSQPGHDGFAPGHGLPSWPNSNN